ncbi:hypothetical protein LZ554_001449 [Drepanopeziza brunnea f. sp. 'monogermtubi']|nr:hypothetical protein LZ554_001449 [Drepanopeziza brunnea f. sp. 'monogermtubi']
MMFINAFVAAAVLAGSAVTALPSALPAEEGLLPTGEGVVSRTIQLCRNKGLTFCGKEAEAPVDTCVDITKGNDMITSFDTGSLTCTFYSKNWCDLSGEYFEFTGKTDDIATTPELESWDNDISSYECK